MITINSSQNPWRHLSEEAPYLATIDKNEFNDHAHKPHGLHLNVLPDPYLGNIDQAEVILLALNPGYQEADLSVNMQSQLYREQSRLNLIHESDLPFYMLDDRLSFSGGYKWWTRTLKPLITTGIPLQTLATKLMCIQYLPYHSTTYYHLGSKLPSQEYSFNLVRKAMEQNKLVIVMRSERIWLEAIPELKNYPYLKIRNPRNPVISPKNLGEQQFQEVIDKLQ